MKGVFKTKTKAGRSKQKRVLNQLEERRESFVG